MGTADEAVDLMVGVLESGMFDGPVKTRRETLVERLER